MSLSQILLCTFFSNSIFIPSWFLIKPWQYYSEQQKKHIQERAYQCLWNKYITFAQKYHNSTKLSMWIVYATCVSKNSIVYHDVIFYLLWYNMIRSSSHIRKNSSFLFVKLTKCDKFEWGEKCHYQVTYFLNGPIFNLLFFCHIVLYWEKVTSYEKFSHNLTLEVQILWKISDR